MVKRYLIRKEGVLNGRLEGEMTGRKQEEKELG